MKRYITKARAEQALVIEIGDANFIVATACLSYLQFRYFDREVADEQLNDWIQRGVYALHDYAISYWLTHVTQAHGVALERSRTEILHGVIENLKLFLASRWSSHAHQYNKTVIPRGPLHSLKTTHPELFDQIAIVTTYTWRRQMCLSNTRDDGMLDKDPIDLSAISIRIRTRLEELDATSTGGMNDTHRRLRKYYGNFYYCPHAWCPSFRVGFGNKDMRDKHTEKHQQFKCPIPDCEFQSIGFHTQNDLDGHYKDIHESSQHPNSIFADWTALDDQVLIQYLFAGARAAEVSVVRSLLSTQRDFDIDYASLLRATVTGGSVEVCRLVFTSCPKVVTPELGADLLRLAIDEGKDDRLSKYLVQLGREYIPLQWGRTKKTKDYPSFSALHCAIVRGWEPLIKLLLEEGASIEYICGFKTKGIKRVCSPLQAAILCQSSSIMDFLLKNGASLHTKGFRGRQALHNAMEASPPDLRNKISILLSYNSDVNSKDTDGRTPLWTAASSGNEAVARLLLERDDVDVNSKDKEGQAPLWGAARYGHEAVARLLLEREDVDVNSKDMYEQTPLWTAARNGHDAVVRLLLAREDVDINSKNQDGLTPLTIASRCRYKVVKQLLEEHGGVGV